ncbi:MAG TPA: alpha/beta fold hydrolase [Gaiellaceae bacterium]|nr:alpha/beta fold hydrolase [Gaiellaceae bacterium]
MLLAGAAILLAVVLLLQHPSGAGTSPAGSVAGAVSVAATSCKPTKQHPYPVILVPGTLVVTTWNVLEPALVKRGYCVYRFAYGHYGTAEIGGSAKKLASFIDTVLAGTHARKVSIVGHSQGGMLPRYYIEFLGGARKVEDLIGLSPSNHGTINPAIAATGTPCEACLEQLWGSAFLAKLNRGAETPAPPDYTVVQTLDDAVLVPYTSAFLAGPASRVTNITIQTACPAVYVSHLGMPSDPVALQWVENALARKGPANPRFMPVC